MGNRSPALVMPSLGGRSQATHFPSAENALLDLKSVPAARESDMGMSEVSRTFPGRSSLVLLPPWLRLRVRLQAAVPNRLRTPEPCHRPGCLSLRYALGEKPAAGASGRPQQQT